jgi:hypothetical protein
MFERFQNFALSVLAITLVSIDGTGVSINS